MNFLQAYYGQFILGFPLYGGIGGNVRGFSRLREICDLGQPHVSPLERAPGHPQL